MESSTPPHAWPLVQCSHTEVMVDVLEVGMGKRLYENVSSVVSRSHM